MKKALCIKQFLFYGLLCFCLSACSTRKHSLFNAPTDIITDTIKQVYVVNDQGGDAYYKIKPNDLLSVSNLQNKEFGATNISTSNNITNNNTTASNTNVLTYEVNADGTANLPAIGKVAVGGLSRMEAQAKIEAIYKEKLLTDPIIELSIVNLKVTLLGEFNKQGNYLLSRDQTSLIEIIGEAGGITKTADPKTLKIIRGDKSHPEIIYVNLNDINSLASKKLILQNKDIVVINSAKNAALNEKSQNFNNIVQPLLVVINLAVLIFTLTR